MTRVDLRDHSGRRHSSGKEIRRQVEFGVVLHVSVGDKADAENEHGQEKARRSHADARMPAFVVGMRVNTTDKLFNKGKVFSILSQISVSSDLLLHLHEPIGVEIAVSSAGIEHFCGLL